VIEFEWWIISCILQLKKKTQFKTSMRIPATQTFKAESNWINGANELWLISVICFSGLLSAVYFFPLLDHYPYNSGPNLLAAYLPLFLSVCYLVVMSYRFKTDKKILVKTFLLYFILIAPYTPLMLQVFKPTFGDDFHRYYTYARFMIDHKTLYGGDSLAFPGMGRYYLTQPGYRYFIAGELVLFRDLFRFVQFINLALLLLGIFFFIQVLTNQSTKHSTWILLIILLFTPYAIKNTLMGLSEWFTAFLLMLATWLYVMKRSAAAAIFVLALVPFFRQNLLIAILLIALYIFLQNRNKWALLPCFLVPILLPLYHNLYFAGEWRFLVKLHAVPLFNSSSSVAFNTAVIGKNLFRLVGLEITERQVRFDWMAFAFLPLALFMMIPLTRSLSKRWRWYFILMALAALLPGLFLGKDYYPRFEFMSIVVILTGYKFFISSKNNG
jgi:hypothetical protein